MNRPASASSGARGFDLVDISDAIPDIDDESARLRATSRRASAFVVASVVVAATGLAPAFVPVAIFAAAVVLVSRMSARSPGTDIAVVRTLSADEVEVGSTVDVSIRLTNRSARRYRWLDVRSTSDAMLARNGVDEAVVDLEAGASMDLSWAVSPTRRGFHRIGPTLLNAPDPLGFFEQWALGDDVSWLTVLPRVVAIEAPVGARGAVAGLHVRRSLAEDTDRFAGVREYRRGDPMKRIHWRATARAGALQTRLYEPTALSGITLVVEFSEAAIGSLDLTAPQRARALARCDEEDLLVTTAASMASYVLRSGRRLAFWSNGTDAAVHAPRTGPSMGTESAAMEVARAWSVTGRPAPDVALQPGRGETQEGLVLRVLARLLPGTAAPLSTSIAGRAGAFERDLVVVIVTPTLDERFSRAVDALRSAGLSVAVLWTCATGRIQVDPGLLAADTPVWRITCDDDLRAMAEVRL